MKNADKPLWLMTAGEFIDLIKGQQKIEVKADTSLVYGIGGLADLLGVSKPTAQKIKNSGKISDATIQIGRSICFDREKVIELLKQ